MMSEGCFFKSPKRNAKVFRFHETILSFGEPGYRGDDNFSYGNDAIKQHTVRLMIISHLEFRNCLWYKQQRVNKKNGWCVSNMFLFLNLSGCPQQQYLGGKDPRYSTNHGQPHLLHHQINKTSNNNKIIHTPADPCMVYLPTFTIKITQM